MIEDHHSTGRRRKELAPHADPKVAAAIDALLDAMPEGTRNRDLLHELITTATTLPGDGADRGELKLLAATLKDFHRSFKVFGEHRGRRKISIFGSARSPAGSPIYEHAKRFAAAAVEKNYMVITGAGPGIMQAGNEGATRAHSFGVSILLPFEASANPVIDGDPKLVEFKYFFTRKLSFVKESDAIVLFPGGYGTMDEGFESLTLLQTGKCDPLPVVLMDTPGGDYWTAWERYLRQNLQQRNLISPYDRNLYRFTTNVEQAIAEIEQFYSVYHSLRYVGNYTILRLKSAPSAALLARLNERYQDLLAEGAFEQMAGPHPAERNEPEAIRALPRIGFRFVQRRFGLLRRLIDEINLAEPRPAAPALDPPHGTAALAMPAPGANGEDEPSK